MNKPYHLLHIRKDAVCFRCSFQLKCAKGSIWTLRLLLKAPWAAKLPKLQVTQWHKNLKIAVDLLNVKFPETLWITEKIMQLGDQY